MLGNYYSYPGTTMYPRTPQAGLGTITSDAVKGMFGVGSLIRFALRAGAGYYLGGYFGQPVVGAALSGFLGLWGLTGLALFAARPATALPNRKRRRHHRRHRG